MNGYPVIKGASYTLAITPDMVLHNGTTQTTERVVNPDSEYLKELPGHLRSFEDAVNAWKAGARRVELNSALHLGGLTPSASCLDLVKKHTGLYWLPAI